MAQSMNSTVDLTIRATSFAGLGTYGHMMVGNAALEFYNERNPEDYIQIPWEEVDHIAAGVVGKKIVRFAVFVRQGGHFAFSTRDNIATLRAVRSYVDEEKLVRSASFFDVIKAGLRGLWSLVTTPFRRHD